MSNSYCKTERINGNIDHNKAILRKAIGANILKNQKEADMFSNGLRKVMGMSEDDRSKLFNTPANEVIKKAKDGDARFFVATLDKSMAVVSHTMAGTLYSSPVSQKILAKDMHVDGMKDDSAASRIVDMALRSEADGNIDLGWQQAFRVENAQDVERLKLHSWGILAQMLEYKNYDSKPEFQSFGNVNYGELGPRYFMSAMSYQMRKQRFSFIALNRLLSAMRLEAVQTMSRLAYRTIFNGAGVPTQKASTKFTGEAKYSAYEIDVYNARRTLTDARRQLINNANGIERGSKRVRHNGGKSTFPANVTSLFYVNHNLGAFLHDVQYMNRGTDNTNPTLYGNMAILETIEAPMTGSWKVAELDATRDEMGFYEEVKEGSTLDNQGGMLVLPGEYNILGIFRNLTFITATDAIPEAEKIVAKQEMNAVMGEGQRRHVLIGKNLVDEV